MILMVILIQYVSKINFWIKIFVSKTKFLKSVRECCLCKKCLNLNNDRECVCCLEIENLQKLGSNKKWIILNY